MGHAPPPVRLLFDYISPNAYIAWTQIHALAARHGREVEPVPVLFAGLLGAHGLLGPAEVRPKWEWMVRDILRKGARLDIPLAPPRSHPFNPLLALRVTGLPMDPVTRRRLIDGLFRAVWGGGPGVTDPATVARIATFAGLDGAGAVRAAEGDEAKARLRRQTEEAVAAGAFGVPTMLVGDDLFWGYDDFGHLEACLAGQDRLDRAALDAWRAVRPSALRREASRPDEP